MSGMDKETRPEPFVRVEIYADPDDVSSERGFHGPLSWVYRQLGTVVADEERYREGEAFKAARGGFMPGGTGILTNYGDSLPNRGV